MEIPLKYILNWQYQKFVTRNITSNLLKTGRLFKRFVLNQSNKLCVIEFQMHDVSSCSVNKIQEYLMQ